MNGQPAKTRRKGRQRVIVTVVCVLVAVAGATYGVFGVVIPDSQSQSFTIGGTLGSALRPGDSVPFDLHLTNLHRFPILITGLRVTVRSVSGADISTRNSCSTSDFSVTPFSGAYRFRLDPLQTISLSDLGFASAQWPRITMLDQSIDQNECQGALLTFDLAGTAELGR